MIHRTEQEEEKSFGKPIKTRGMGEQTSVAMSWKGEGEGQSRGMAIISTAIGDGGGPAGGTQRFRGCGRRRLMLLFGRGPLCHSLAVSVSCSSWSCSTFFNMWCDSQLAWGCSIFGFPLRQSRSLPLSRCSPSEFPCATAGRRRREAGRLAERAHDHRLTEPCSLPSRAVTSRRARASRRAD